MLLICVVKQLLDQYEKLLATFSTLLLARLDKKNQFLHCTWHLGVVYIHGMPSETYLTIITYSTHYPMYKFTLQFHSMHSILSNHGFRFGLWTILTSRTPFRSFDRVYHMRISVCMWTGMPDMGAEWGNEIPLLFDRLVLHSNHWAPLITAVIWHTLHISLTM